MPISCGSFLTNDTSLAFTKPWSSTNPSSSFSKSSGVAFLAKVTWYSSRRATLGWLRRLAISPSLVNRIKPVLSFSTRSTGAMRSRHAFLIKSPMVRRPLGSYSTAKKFLGLLTST